MACHQCRLIVELDGETHLGREREDEAWAQYLTAHGWLVLRFWNPQVYDELESVLEVIYRACQERKPEPPPSPPTPLPLSTGGEGRKNKPQS
jgi:very-short-patch-repair endonuclease